uniref:Uncharacterized protein n=1 Tax=Oryza glumipatula TaxID=40148 RepID=A0A0E0BLV0_9ORYZ
MATSSLNPNSIVDLEKGTAAARKKRTACRDEDDDDDSTSTDAHTGMAVMMLLMYYAFFMFYMIGTCEKWWHAALAIGIASVFVLLSVCCMLPRNNTDSPADSQQNTQTGIGTRLLAAHQ